MASHKRMHSDSLYDGAKPTKSSKVHDSPPPSDALEIANARIGDLEQQIQDLHKFINAKGLTRTVPPSIQQHMNQQPNAAKILARQIHDAAAEVYERLSAKADRARKTGVTSDDLSASIMDFLDEVEVVRDLPGGVPLAFNLVMTLAEHSYGGLDGGGSGYGDRPSYPEVDRLISELAVERRQMEPSWNHEGALESMEYQNKYLREYGINGFCSASIKLLSGWEKAAPTVVDLTIIHESGRAPSPGEELSYCEAWLYR